MGQRLHVIRLDKYRLNIEAFDNKEFGEIKRGDSKYNYRLSIKEKLSLPAIRHYDADISDGKIGFDIQIDVQFGTYLYVIEKIDLKKETVEELAYGFIEIHPDV